MTGTMTGTITGKINATIIGTINVTIKETLKGTITGTMIDTISYGSWYGECRLNGKWRVTANSTHTYTVQPCVVKHQEDGKTIQ